MNLMENCFPNSVSSIVYGHENHKSIHAKLIVAGVLFKSILLEDIYLSCSRNDDENILTKQFAMYSVAYNHVHTDTWNPIVTEEIYKTEGDKKYCGIYQLANVLHRPVRSVYSQGYLLERYRKDLSRTAYPKRLHERDRKPVVIMWTHVMMNS